MLNNFVKQIGNLTYVQIDRTDALRHWGTCTESVGNFFWELNFITMARMKAVAGILGHRSNSNFRIHVIKERITRDRRGWDV